MLFWYELMEKEGFSWATKLFFSVPLEAETEWVRQTKVLSKMARYENCSPRDDISFLNGYRCSRAYSWPHIRTSVTLDMHQNLQHRLHHSNSKDEEYNSTCKPNNQNPWKHQMILQQLTWFNSSSENKVTCLWQKHLVGEGILLLNTLLHPVQSPNTTLLVFSLYNHWIHTCWYKLSQIYNTFIQRYSLSKSTARAHHKLTCIFSLLLTTSCTKKTTKNMRILQKNGERKVACTKKNEMHDCRV